MDSLKCRLCQKTLAHEAVDLGMSPLANSYVPPERFHSGEVFHPLRVFICDDCWLMQLPESASPEDIFSHYAYFSSFSTSWLAHAERYANEVSERFGIGTDSKVFEVASNDGYLLRNFVQRGIQVLGIEPAKNVAETAIKNGIPTETVFLGADTGAEISSKHGRANLVAGNNVLAHVPNIRDFVTGLRTILHPEGVLTMEFPHLLRLLEEKQFDTIYHEHYSYLSLIAVKRLFADHELEVFDVEQLETHGGSLRIFVKHRGFAAHEVSDRVGQLIQEEQEYGINSLEVYQAFSGNVSKVKFDLLRFLIGEKEQGKQIAAYGAAAKGNTLLNYCGIGTELISFVVDKNPHKQGNLLPGSRVPIVSLDKLKASRPDVILILPWNLRKEIIGELEFARDWGAKFVTAIPEVKVFNGN